LGRRPQREEVGRYAVCTRPRVSCASCKEVIIAAGEVVVKEEKITRGHFTGIGLLHRGEGEALYIISGKGNFRRGRGSAGGKPITQYADAPPPDNARGKKETTLLLGHSQKKIGLTGPVNRKPLSVKWELFFEAPNFLTSFVLLGKGQEGK